MGTDPEVEARARRSLGSSSDPIYRMVARVLAERDIRGDSLVDVGCGGGHLWSYVSDRFTRYVGVDAVRYEGFPARGEFHPCNLDREKIPLADGAGAVVVAVETIEHLENPRAFFRELVRIAKPGGWVMVTTPNQLSLLSKLTLLVKNRFNAFQDNMYPAHITALLECDLRRMAGESKLEAIETGFSLQGRLPGGACHYPKTLSAGLPQLFSDNVGVLGRKPC